MHNCKWMTAVAMENQREDMIDMASATTGGSGLRPAWFVPNPVSPSRVIHKPWCLCIIITVNYIKIKLHKRRQLILFFCFSWHVNRDSGLAGRGLTSELISSLLESWRRASGTKAWLTRDRLELYGQALLEFHVLVQHGNVLFIHPPPACIYLLNELIKKERKASATVQVS